MDDASAFVDRSHTDLHLRNNETVVSGMTDCSWDTPQHNTSHDSSDQALHAASLPPSRFRGGTASRFGHGMGSGGSVGGYSRSSKLDRSVRSDFGPCDPIAEGDEDQSVGSGADPSVGMRNYRTTAGGDDSSIWMGSENSSVYRGNVANNVGAPGRFGGGASVASYGQASGAGEMYAVPEGNDGDSVVSGLSHQRSIASQFHRPTTHTPQPPPPSSGASVASTGQTSVGTQRHRPPAPYTRDDEASVATSHRSVASQRQAPHISPREQADILLNAFDDARLPTHVPKPTATREIDVALYQDAIVDADEITPLPEEYVLDGHGRRYHPEKEEEERSVDPRTRRAEVEMLSLGGGNGAYQSPFAEGRRWHTLATVLAAVLLAMVGLTMSVRSLSSGPQGTVTGRGGDGGGYVYLPGHQFGGGVGGLEGGKEMERRFQLAGSPYDTDMRGGGAPLTSDTGYAPAVGTPAGGGYTGGRTAFPGGGLASHQVAGADLRDQLARPRFPPASYGTDHPAVLTARPLTSYAPPPHEAGATVILDAHFDPSFLELSVLPYNPAAEMPVVLDIPLSGGAATKAILGTCLRLVQCSERGRDILAREREAWLEQRSGGEGRRNLMTLVPKEGGAGASVSDGKVSYVRSINPHEGEAAVRTNDDPVEASLAPFDPPLRTEVVYTSEYVNVDCSTTAGIDRGVAKNLASSNMADVVYSRNIRDTARLFAPPMETRGRAVVVLRDPIERAVAKYEWLRGIDEVVGGMTLEQFAASDRLEDNILTRALVDKSSDDALAHQDLIVAKEILKRKFVVGLFDRMDESMERIETFFGWKVGDGARACQQNQIRLVKAKPYNQSKVPADSSPAWRVLAERLQMDTELYDYVRYLFDYQGRVLFGITGIES